MIFFRENRAIFAGFVPLPTDGWFIVYRITYIHITQKKSYQPTKQQWTVFKIENFSKTRNGEHTNIALETIKKCMKKNTIFLDWISLTLFTTLKYLKRQILMLLWRCTDYKGIPTTAQLSNIRSISVESHRRRTISTFFYY